MAHLFIAIVTLQPKLLRISFSDPAARKINVAKFTNKKTMVMIVTDVAVSIKDNLSLHFKVPDSSVL